ncbi:flagellar basal body-associated FliL family protein [Aquabacterium sp.]|jgi:flagellar protein FliL|uniref:flagellar basal body-associated FliL family protein n=1 Tax=Aquabacterium sp. TaxID=1872578 RepID=UPI002489A528|nr:flagellar basal body-associated FliL family protein [Aquabacterium sp.]MDI1350757.1 flagellar basal body-associated FliL family protein [Aquabacterium sp.]
MSAAPAAPAEGDAPKKGSKKLIIIGAAVAVLLAGGGGAFFMMKKKADAEAAAAAEGEDGEAEHAAPGKQAKKPEHGKDEHKGPPTFVPLDPFIVNLADKEGERFAQIGVSLQVDDAKIGEEMKGYMPAIRNSVLLILSHKTSAELLSIEGKQKLAEEIRRDAARAMGYEIEDPEDEEAAAKAEEDAPKKKKKKKKKVESYNPIVHVHYSNFIIQ